MMSPVDIKWTRHHDVTKCLFKNQVAIINILSEDSEDSVEASDISTAASGLLMMLRRHHFFEIEKFILLVLCALKPANLCCAG